MPISLFPDIYVPTFEIKVENTPLPPAIARQITSVSVTQNLDPPTAFSLSFYDPRLQLLNKEEGLFAEGKRIEISMGYVGNIRRMIIGEIASLNVNFADSNAITASVQGFDLLHRLSRGTAYRKFLVPDSEIASRLAQEMGLEADAETTGSRSEPRVQDNLSNLEFLRRLAQANNYSFWVDGNTLYFKTRRPTTNTVRLEWGKTLVNFSPQLTTSGLVNTIEVRNWNQEQRQPISESDTLPTRVINELSASGQRQVARGAGEQAGGASRQSKHVIANTPISNSQEALTLAQAEMERRVQSLIQGNGTAVGHPEIQIGTRLELRGIYRFSGAYIVNRVTHELGEGGYQTSFQVEREL